MSSRERAYTRRQFMAYDLIMGGMPVWDAVEQVATYAQEHPELDLDEELTWGQWRLEQVTRQ